MKGVKQTILNPPNGNCFAACVATVLDLTLEDVPSYQGPLWWDNWVLWGEHHGYEFTCYWTVDMDWCPVGPWLAGPQSPRNPLITHAVVVDKGEIVWDPYPNPEPVDLTTNEDCILIRRLSDSA